jgi:hypothetical protein
MSAAIVSLWRDDRLEPRDDCDVQPATIEAADSWLVVDGAVRGIELHRTRFMTSIPRETHRRIDAGAFWDASIAAIPRGGSWFPRVELRTQSQAPRLLLRLREAPERRRSIVLRSHRGRDPRTAPRVKGPDLEALELVGGHRLVQHVDAQGRGEGEDRADGDPVDPLDVVGGDA